MSNTKSMKLVSVLVNRGKSNVHAVVFPHEVPILRAVHTAERVEEIESDHEPLEIPDDADQEFARLCKRYNGKGPDGENVRLIYPTPSALAQASGLGLTGRAKVDEAPKSVQRSGKTAKPAKGAGKA